MLLTQLPTFHSLRYVNGVAMCCTCALPGAHSASCRPGQYVGTLSAERTAAADDTRMCCGIMGTHVWGVTAVPARQDRRLSARCVRCWLGQGAECTRLRRLSFTVVAMVVSLYQGGALLCCAVLCTPARQQPCTGPRTPWP